MYVVDIVNGRGEKAKGKDTDQSNETISARSAVDINVTAAAAAADDDDDDKRDDEGDDSDIKIKVTLGYWLERCLYESDS